MENIDLEAGRVAGTVSAATYPIRAVDRVCDILDSLRDHPSGQSLTELADVTELPKSSVLRYLSSLEARSYAERSPSGLFVLGSVFRPKHAVYLEQVAAVALPFLTVLRDQFGETVNLGARDGNQIVHVQVAESQQSVRLAAERDQHAPIHSTAIGKVIAATMPDELVLDLLRQAGMNAITQATITDPQDFVHEIHQVRDRGYGIDDMENQPDGRCVAVLIDDTPVPMAVSVSAPATRLSRDDVGKVARQLRRAAVPLRGAVQAVTV